VSPRKFVRLAVLSAGIGLWTLTLQAAPHGSHEGSEAADVSADAGEHGEHAGGHGDTAHGDAAHGDAAHGHGGHHDAPTFADINWFHGFLGEKEGVAPSFLWREPGTPVPLGALLLNTAILFYFLGRFGGPAIRSGLVARKQRIAGDIEAAQRMQEEAKGQLEHYEQKLAHMAAETERILADVRAQAKSEHERIVADAKARHVALQEEARQIIEHERAHARQAAIVSLVERAIDGAREEILKSLRPDDQERLAKALQEKVEGPLGAGVLRQGASGSHGVQS